MLDVITKSLRSRLIVANLVMLVPLFMMVILGYITFDRITTSFDEALSESIGELVPITHLEYSILGASIPLQGYLIHGSIDELNQFRTTAKEIKVLFEKVQQLKPLKEEQKIILQTARKEWDYNLQLANKIMRYKPPFSTEAAVMMELFDLRIKKLNDKLKIVRKHVNSGINELRKRTKKRQADGAILTMLIFSISTLVAIFIGVFMGRSIIRPLKELEHAAERFSGGDMGVRIEVTSDDEIGRLALTFNTMAQEIENLVIHDPLTELLNKREFEKRLSSEMERAGRYKKSLSLLMIDIDYFKNVNDVYGHQVGDLVLRLVSSVIINQVRSIDHAARYGGEELVVILPEANIEDALKKAEAIRKSIEVEKFFYTEHEFLNVTVSIGVACYDQEATHQTELVTAADKALYTAKRQGRNRVEPYLKK